MKPPYQDKCMLLIYMCMRTNETLSNQRGNYEGEQYGILNQRGKEEVMRGKRSDKCDLLSSLLRKHYVSVQKG